MAVPALSPWSSPPPPVSLSVTNIVSVPLVCPLADAVIVTACVPSAKKSSTADTVNVTELDPFGIDTKDGTTASLVSLLMRLTNSEPEKPLRLTVAEDEPPFSGILVWRTFNVSTPGPPPPVLDTSNV